jgi:hypothetical protein
MNLQTTTSSTSRTPVTASTWPQNAAPEHWVSSLFEKMARTWGSRFLDQWRDMDLQGVKEEWGKALAKLSNAELKAGVGALITLKYPPSLPEFYALCKQTRLHEAPRQESLTDQTRADPRVVAENMALIRPMIAKILNRKPSAEWAFKLLARGTSASGLPLTHEVRRCATDAVLSSAGRLFMETASEEDRELYALMHYEIVTKARATGHHWETP